MQLIAAGKIPNTLLSSAMEMFNGKAGEKQCMDILRTDDEADLDACANGKIAVMFTVAYLYEHREEADHHAMDLTLRALLFGSRKEGF